MVAAAVHFINLNLVAIQTNSRHETKEDGEGTGPLADCVNAVARDGGYLDTTSQGRFGWVMMTD